MRKYADYHTHSTFSDGCQTREEMAQAALDGGLYAIGFTDHAPMPFERNYAIKDTWLPDTIAETDHMATSAVSDIVPLPVFIIIVFAFYLHPSNSRADSRFAQVEKKW